MTIGAHETELAFPTASEALPVSDDELLEALGSPGRLTELAVAARPVFETALGNLVDEHRLAVTHGVLTSLHVALEADAQTRVDPPNLTIRAVRPGPRGSLVWLGGPFLAGGHEIGTFEATGFLVGESVPRSFGNIRRQPMPAGQPGEAFATVELDVQAGLASRLATLIDDENPIHHHISAAAAMGMTSLPLPALAIFALAEHGIGICLPGGGNRWVRELGFRMARPVLEGELFEVTYRNGPVVGSSWRHIRFAGRAGGRTSIKSGAAHIHEIEATANGAVDSREEMAR